MWREVVLATALIAVVFISGCATYKTQFIEASDNLSQSVLKFYGDYAEMLRTINKLIPVESYDPMFSEVCPVYEAESLGKFIGYEYYLNECDLSKINMLKDSDNFTGKFNYWSLSFHKAHSILADEAYSTLSEIYDNENLTVDNTLEEIGKDAANKVIDTLASLYDTTIDMAVYQYTGNWIYECNSSTCIDSVFQKFEASTSEITKRIKFDNNFLDSCKNYFRGIDKEDNIGMIKTQLGELFKEVGYSGNVDNYISYDSICQRFKTVYSSIYDGILDGVDEPNQEFVIALTFFALSTFHEDYESFSNSVDQIIG